jgi:hypothetical protein
MVQILMIVVVGPRTFPIGCHLKMPFKEPDINF